MKAKRQALIREIVESQSIQTQEELAEALRVHGMVVTQATVSRDIKESAKKINPTEWECE